MFLYISGFIQYIQDWLLGTVRFSFWSRSDNMFIFWCEGLQSHQWPTLGWSGFEAHSVIQVRELSSVDCEFLWTLWPLVLFFTRKFRISNFRPPARGGRPRGWQIAVMTARVMSHGHTRVQNPNCASNACCAYYRDNSKMRPQCRPVFSIVVVFCKIICLEFYKPYCPALPSQFYWLYSSQWNLNRYLIGISPCENVYLPNKYQEVFFSPESACFNPW